MAIDLPAPTALSGMEAAFKDGSFRTQAFDLVLIGDTEVTTGKRSERVIILSFFVVIMISSMILILLIILLLYYLTIIVQQSEEVLLWTVGKLIRFPGKPHILLLVFFCY